MAQPPIVSECSVLGGAVGSGLLFPDSSSHNTDGLKSRSRKILEGRRRILRRCVSTRWLRGYYPGLHGGIRVLRTELTFLGQRYGRLPFFDPWRQSIHLLGILRGLNPRAPPGVVCPWMWPSEDHVVGPRIRLRCWSPCIISRVHTGRRLQWRMLIRLPLLDLPTFWSRQNT